MTSAALTAAGRLKPRSVGRLVHETFLAAYGPEYLDATGEDGTRLFRKKTIKVIEVRRREEPSRYARPIDAATLDDLVRIIYKPETYNRHFVSALRAAFPEGPQEARTFLDRLVDIRNKLSHANPISVHEAARAICYTQDVIASLKEHYATMNQQKEYDVPTIIRVADSLGHVRHESELISTGLGCFCDFSNEASGRLHPGERLTIEVEVDPTYERSSYRFRWMTFHGTPPSSFNDDVEYVTIEIDDSHVGRIFDVRCEVTSNKGWHRYGRHDDMVDLRYKVRPPPS
jgi:hypothetical protein